MAQTGETAYTFNGLFDINGTSTKKAPSDLFRKITDVGNGDPVDATTDVVKLYLANASKQIYFNYNNTVNILDYFNKTFARVSNNIISISNTPPYSINSSQTSCTLTNLIISDTTTPYTGAPIDIGYYFYGINAPDPINLSSCVASANKATFAFANASKTISSVIVLDVNKTRTTSYGSPTATVTNNVASFNLSNISVNSSYSLYFYFINSFGATPLSQLIIIPQVPIYSYATFATSNTNNSLIITKPATFAATTNATYGYFYDTTNPPNINSNVNAINSFSTDLNITNLTGNTVYYFRSYSNYGDKIKSYSDVIAVGTSPDVFTPTLSLNSVVVYINITLPWPQAQPSGVTLFFYAIDNKNYASYDTKAKLDNQTLIPNSTWNSNKITANVSTCYSGYNDSDIGIFIKFRNNYGNSYSYANFRTGMGPIDAPSGNTTIAGTTIIVWRLPSYSNYGDVKFYIIANSVEKQIVAGGTSVPTTEAASGSYSSNTTPTPVTYAGSSSHYYWSFFPNANTVYSIQVKAVSKDAKTSVTSASVSYFTNHLMPSLATNSTFMSLTGGTAITSATSLLSSPSYVYKTVVNIATWPGGARGSWTTLSATTPKLYLFYKFVLINNSTWNKSNAGATVNPVFNSSTGALTYTNPTTINDWFMSSYNGTSLNETRNSVAISGNRFCNLMIVGYLVRVRANVYGSLTGSPPYVMEVSTTEGYLTSGYPTS